jgi:hypothetical protein
VQLYKPNAKGTGHAVGINIGNSKAAKLHFQFVKQTGWNSESKTGTFKGGDKFNISLGIDEVGALLNTIERGRGEKLFHSSEKGDTQIEFRVYQPDENKAADGITISVNPRAKEGEDAPLKYGFWFDAGQARALRSYLEFALEKFFSAEYSADKQRMLAKKAEQSAAGTDTQTDNSGF